MEGRKFPYGWPGLVCYFELPFDATGLEQIRTRDAMADAIRRARAEATTIYAVWPGQYRSNLFFVDDLDALAAKTIDTRKRTP